MKRTKTYKRQLHKKMLIAGITLVVMMASLFACLKPMFVSEKKTSVVENSATDSISFTNTGNGLGISVTASNNSGVNSIQVYTGNTQIASYTYNDGKTVHSETITSNTVAFGASKAYSLVVNGQTTVNTTLTNNRYISDAADMVAFRNSVNGGNDYSGKYVEMTKDIDLSSVCSSTKGSWIPISTFAGTFNGNYHTINNLYFNSSAYQTAGFFQILRATAIVEHTVFDNIYLYNSAKNANVQSTAGGIAHNNSGKIIECGIKKGTIATYNTGTTVNGTWAICITAGIAAYNTATGEILRCFNGANVSSTRTYTGATYFTEVFSGGIVRKNTWES